MFLTHRKSSVLFSGISVGIYKRRRNSPGALWASATATAMWALCSGAVALISINASDSRFPHKLRECLSCRSRRVHESSQDRSYTFSDRRVRCNGSIFCDSTKLATKEQRVSIQG